MDFDQHANSYTDRAQDLTKAIIKDSAYFAKQKIHLLSRLCNKQPSTILDFGCGVGRNIEFILKYFPSAKLSGTDISEKSIDAARESYPTASFSLFDDSFISDHSKTNFDIIFISCVLHHIEPPERQKTINILYQKLAPNGQIFIFEHNTLNPLTMHYVNNCEWDDDAIMLKSKESKSLLSTAGLFGIKTGYFLFFPDFLKIFSSLEKHLSWLPLGGQYYTHGTKNM